MDTSANGIDAYCSETEKYRGAFTIDKYQHSGRGRPPPIVLRSLLLPSLVAATSLDKVPHRVTIGLSDEDLAPTLLDPTVGLFSVFGPSGSGKTTALIRVGTGAAHLAEFGSSFFASARRIESIAGPWDHFASGPDVVATMLTKALEELVSDRRPIIIIDDVTDILEGDAGLVLNDVVRAAREHPGLVVVAGDAGQARRGYSDGLTEIRSRKTGLLLQPDFDYDGDLLGTTLLRPGGRTFPPGRGYLVLRGTSSLIQTAIDGMGAEQ